MTLVTPLKQRALESFDPRLVRRDFPIFERNPGLVFLDSGASAQKPAVVIDAVAEFFRNDYANVHRGVYRLSARSTELYEDAREAARHFLNAADAREIVFVRGATEGINLVAQSHGRRHVRAGDEILVTELEHHSNIVPWQLLCSEKGARLRVLPIDDRGEVRLEELDGLLGPRTRIVAVSHVSNSLGTVLPVAEISRRARAAGAIVVVDGAQAAPHVPVDVQALGCDFYVFSGHKVYGPTGAGALWGRLPLLEAMPPWQGGGDMILSVRFDATTYRDPPHKFEAGTPDILGVLGLGAALDWIAAKGVDRLAAHEGSLLARATRTIGALPGVRIVGTARDKAAILSFVVQGIHAHDVGTALDLDGIAVRTGHHCTQPAMDRFGLEATVRASFGAYSTERDVDALAAGLERARAVLGPGR